MNQIHFEERNERLESILVPVDDLMKKRPKEEIYQSLIFEMWDEIKKDNEMIKHLIYGLNEGNYLEEIEVIEEYFDVDVETYIEQYKEDWE